MLSIRIDELVNEMEVKILVNGQTYPIGEDYVRFHLYNKMYRHVRDEVTSSLRYQEINMICRMLTVLAVVGIEVEIC